LGAIDRPARRSLLRASAPTFYMARSQKPGSDSATNSMAPVRSTPLHDRWGIRMGSGPPHFAMTDCSARQTSPRGQAALYTMALVRATRLKNQARARITVRAHLRATSRAYRARRSDTSCPASCSAAVPPYGDPGGEFGSEGPRENIGARRPRRAEPPGGAAHNVGWCPPRG
jgi:hypothetical protein